MSPSIGRSTIGASEREIDYLRGHAARYGGLTPYGSEPATSRLVLYIGADSITARACSGSGARQPVDPETGLFAKKRTLESIMTSDHRYWFPAKRYGWGWGLPIAWQGWAVLFGFLGLIFAGAVSIRPHQHLIGFIVYVVVMICLFTGVCWLKGEPARWRWGRD